MTAQGKERVLLAATSGQGVAGQCLQWATTVFLVVYLSIVLTRRSTTTTAESLPQDGGPAVSYMSPEWLRVPLLRDLSPNLLSLHYTSGIALVVCAIVQKQLLPLMARGQYRRLARTLHARVFGPLTVVAMVGMAAGGYLMRHEPDLPHFTSAMVGFVAPWVAFVALVWPSAAWGAWRLHAIAGEAVVKACIAVPLARVLGALLQRVDSSAVRFAFERVPMLRTIAEGWFGSEHAVAALSFTDGSGYYTGIATSAVVVGLWAVLDLLGFLRRVQERAKGE